MSEAPPVPFNSAAPDALLRELDGPAFAEPWMAQAFACAVHLSRQGLFTWNEWVDVFSAEIKAHPQQPGEAANAAYYRQWLAALETIVGQKGAASKAEISERQETWRPISTRRTVSRWSCIMPLRRLPPRRTILITTTTTTTTTTTSTARRSRSASVRRGGSFLFSLHGRGV
jgi:nitrile hydratase accessory protein